MTGEQRIVLAERAPQDVRDATASSVRSTVHAPGRSQMPLYRLSSNVTFVRSGRPACLKPKGNALLSNTQSEMIGLPVTAFDRSTGQARHRTRSNRN